MLVLFKNNLLAIQLCLDRDNLLIVFVCLGCFTPSSLRVDDDL
jgi:hypothetical protein